MKSLEELKFAVDDLVVYASHGVGRVSNRQQETVRLEFEQGLSVTLPIALAAECVRPVSTEVELAGIGRTLQGSAVLSEENWQRRLKSTKSKVTGGAAASLAEVIRDAARSGVRVNARKEPVGLSLNERRLYLTARKLLADEIGASRGIDSQSADEWIGDQLAQNVDRASETVALPATVSAPGAELTTSGKRARRRRH